MINIVVNPIVNEVSVSVVENPNNVAILVNEVEQVVNVNVIENSGIATAILVNTEEDVLSETELRNGETKTIIAPNGEANISTANFDIPSGTVRTLYLVNQDDETIVPTNIEDSTITIERYLFTSIDSGTITPNSIYGILDGETSWAN